MQFYQVNPVEFLENLNVQFEAMKIIQPTRNESERGFSSIGMSFASSISINQGTRGHLWTFEITRVFSLRTRVYSKLQYLKISSFHSSLLQRHESVHERKNLIECSSCNICFTFKTELNDHVFNVHGGKKPKVKEKNHHCEECNKSFLDTWKMQRHQKVHLKSKCKDQD